VLHKLKVPPRFVRTLPTGWGTGTLVNGVEVCGQKSPS